MKVYICDKQFATSPISHLFETDLNLFGLSIIHGETAKICTFTSSGHNIIKEIKEELASYHNKGGQSQNRHMRNHDIMVNVYNDKVAEAMKNAYMINGVPNIKGIAIFGTGDKRFSVIGKLPKCLQSIVFFNSTVESQNVTPTMILDKHCQEFISTFTRKNEALVYSEFQKHIDKDTSRAIYGPTEIKNAIKNNSLSKLIVHNSLTEEYKTDNVETFIVSEKYEVGHNLMQNYGGVVGISWY